MTERIPTSEEEKANTDTYTTSALAPSIEQSVHTAVSKLLPGVLQTVLPGLVQSAVSEHLPSALEAVLPILLSSPLSPSPSQSSSSQTSMGPAPKALSVLGAILTKRVVLGLKRELEGIQDQTLSHAEILRSNADTEFHEGLEELRLELVQAQEDLVVDLNRIGDVTLDEFREKCEAEEEEASNRLLQRILAVYDRLSKKTDLLDKGQEELPARERGFWERKDELLRRKSTLLDDERKLLEEERESLARASGSWQ